MLSKTFIKNHLSYTVSINEACIKIDISDDNQIRRWVQYVRPPNRTDKIYKLIGTDQPNITYPTISKLITTFDYEPINILIKFDKNDLTIEMYPVQIDRSESLLKYIINLQNENYLLNDIYKIKQLVYACSTYTYHQLLHIYRTVDIKSYINEIDPDTGHTPLTAISTRSPELLREFLLIKPELDKANIYNYTPIDLVYGMNLPTNALLLINAGLNQKSKIKWGELDGEDCAKIIMDIHRICDFLLNPEANISDLYNNNIYPLCSIFSGSNFAIINPLGLTDKLIARGANIKENNDALLNHVVTSFYECFSGKYTDTLDNNDAVYIFLKYIITNGIDIKSSNVLHNGCFYKYNITMKKFNLFKFLVDNGADIHKCENNINIMDSCLQKLMRGGDNWHVSEIDIDIAETILRFMIELGFKIDCNKNPADIYIGAYKDSPGAIDWFMKLCCKNVIILKLLIKIGANVNTRDGDGKSPLHYATNSSPDIIETLIKNGANVNATDKYGKTPLHYANMNSPNSPNLSIIETLIKNGAIVNAIDNYGDTPLHIATWNSPSNLSIIETLIKNGAQVNAVNKDAKTPLDYGLRDINIVNILIKNGANVNAIDKDGKTLLHIVVEKYPSITETLVKNGANVNAIDKDGRTPLHSATIHNPILSTIETLIKNGANVNAVDNNKQTPLHYISPTSQNLSIIKIFVQKGAKINHYIIDDIFRKQYYHSFSDLPKDNQELLRFIFQNGATIKQNDITEWNLLKSIYKTDWYKCK